MIRLATLAVLLTAAPATAVPWTVVPAQSRIGFTATWLGKPVPGVFRIWTAAIDFDPAAPAKARIVVTIDLASAATGDKTVDGSLPGDDWFAIKAARTARFVAAGVVAKGPGRYVASGSLTMRGRAVPVVLPFSFAVSGDTATVVGQLSLDRRAWSLGTESDATAQYIAFGVPVTVRVVAKRTN